MQVKSIAIFSTFIELPFVIKIFVLSNFKKPFYTGFTVVSKTAKLFNAHTNVFSMVYMIAQIFVYEPSVPGCLYLRQIKFCNS